jgi:hypothetical protein
VVGDDFFIDLVDINVVHFMNPDLHIFECIQYIMILIFFMIHMNTFGLLGFAYSLVFRTDI